MKVAYLVYLVASTTWSPQEVIEYKMPSMEECVASAKSAQISNSYKGRTVSIFCVYKDK